MPTNTDNIWTSRLNGKVPTNFLTNVSSSPSAVAGILSNMINRIGITIIEAPDNIYNPFAMFNKQEVEYGDIVQKYKVPYVAGAAYDPTATDPFTQNKVAPIAQYDLNNWSQQYHITIPDNDLRKAFVSENSFNSFISAETETLMQSLGLDVWIAWKKYLSGSAQFITDVSIDTSDADFGSNLLDMIRSYANDKFRFPSVAYNVAGDMAVSNDVVCIIKASDKLLIDKTLEGIYNLEKAKIDCDFIVVDDFATGGTSETYEAMILDKRALGFYPKPMSMEMIRNPKARTNELYLTMEGTFAIDRFRNAVRIKAQ